MVKIDLPGSIPVVSAFYLIDKLDGFSHTFYVEAEGGSRLTGPLLSVF
jgi:hypothetical protein